MKRIFIGIKIIPESRFAGHISEIKSRLANEAVKWTDRGNIHVTLAFPGNTEENIIPFIESKLNQKCSGFGSFDIRLRGLGIFKSLKDPRIIWTGISGSDSLRGLNSVVVEGLKETGIKIEERPFSPHLTLGRIKHIENRENLNSLLEKFRDTEMQTVNVNEVILYESILKQSGPVYKPLSIFKL